MFFCEAELSKYEETVAIFKEALFDVEYNLDKIKSLLSQALNSIPSMKLSASSMSSNLFDSIFFNKKSPIYFTSVLRQQKFLQKI